MANVPTRCSSSEPTRWSSTASRNISAWSGGAWDGCSFRLNTSPAPGLADIAPPDGAFYIYADVRRFTDNSLKFCEDILRNTGVATAPGIDFDPVDGRHFMRFSFAVGTTQVEDAIERLRPYLSSYRRAD